MTVVEQAVAAMAQAKQEILKLRQENKELLNVLKMVDEHIALDFTSRQIAQIQAVIAKAEASHEL